MKWDEMLHNDIFDYWRVEAETDRLVDSNYERKFIVNVWTRIAYILKSIIYWHRS